MQYRYVNYNKNLTSLEQNRFLANSAQPGVICGFDAILTRLGNSLTLDHSLTGSTTSAGDNVTSRKVGACKSRHGVTVMEDGNITVSVDFNSGNGNIREDILVMNHNWLDSVGGATATYAVIKGSITTQETPVVSNDKTQVIIGRFIIAANAEDHTDTIWLRNKPNIGGLVPFLKDNLGNTLPWPTVAFFNDFNKMNESGIFSVSGTPSNKPVVDKNNYLVIVMRSASNITQLAITPTTGKVYGRGFSTSWSPWVNLNNPDIDIDITALETAIGDRTYTEQNVITNEETITNSLDLLDIAVEGNVVEIQNLLTTVSNLATDKADKTTTITGTGGLEGGGSLAANRTLNVAAGGITDAMLSNVKVKSVSPALLNLKIVDIGDWDMDTVPSKAVNHGLGDYTKIRGVQAIIRNDVGSGQLSYDINRSQGTGSASVPAGAIGTISGTSVTLTRTDTLAFDGVAFSDTPYNRGWLLISYID